MGGGYGQNFAMFANGSTNEPDFVPVPNAFAAQDSLHKWVVAELPLYSYGTASTEATGHATQCLWKDTQTIGCHTMQCGGKMGDPMLKFAYRTICNYFPEGNIADHFTENVLSQSCDLPCSRTSGFMRVEGAEPRSSATS